MFVKEAHYEVRNATGKKALGNYHKRTGLGWQAVNTAWSHTFNSKEKQNTEQLGPKAGLVLPRFRPRQQPSGKTKQEQVAALPQRGHCISLECF